MGGIVGAASSVSLICIALGGADAARPDAPKHVLKVHNPALRLIPLILLTNIELAVPSTVHFWIHGWVASWVSIFSLK